MVFLKLFLWITTVCRSWTKKKLFQFIIIIIGNEADNCETNTFIVSLSIFFNYRLVFAYIKNIHKKMSHTTAKMKTKVRVSSVQGHLFERRVLSHGWGRQRRMYSSMESWRRTSRKVIVLELHWNTTFHVTSSSKGRSDTLRRFQFQYLTTSKNCNPIYDNMWNFNSKTDTTRNF